MFPSGKPGQWTRLDEEEDDEEERTILRTMGGEQVKVNGGVVCTPPALVVKMLDIR